MPTSPSLSSPSALRLPRKDTAPTNGITVGLLGSVGVACMSTTPVTTIWSPVTFQTRFRRYHAFSAMPAPRLGLLSLISWPVAGSMVASCSASELPWSYRITASPLPPGAESSSATSPAPFVLLYVWIRTSAVMTPARQISVLPFGVYLVSQVVARRAGPAGEVQRGMARAAEVRGAVVVDVCSPAHVGEARRVLAAAEIQRAHGAETICPRRAGEAERGQHGDGPDALVEVSSDHHSLRPAVREIRPNPVVMSAVSPMGLTPSRQRPLDSSIDILDSAAGPVNAGAQRGSVSARFNRAPARHACWTRPCVVVSDALGRFGLHARRYPLQISGHFVGESLELVVGMLARPLIFFGG